MTARKLSPVSSLTSSSHEDEATLIRQAGDGSPDAWGEIYTRHSTDIFRYINARVYDADTAEDLTSEVFVSAVKGIRTYRHDGQPFLAWLYRIARNAVSTYQRKMLRRQGIASRVLITNLFGRRRSAAMAPGEKPEVVATDRESGMDMSLLELRQALDKLPSLQREVVMLRFFVGLDAEEIAQVVGKNSSAVYSLQARAMSVLRHEMS